MFKKLSKRTKDEISMEIEQSTFSRVFKWVDDENLNRQNVAHVEENNSDRMREDSPWSHSKSKTRNFGGPEDQSDFDQGDWGVSTKPKKDQSNKDPAMHDGFFDNEIINVDQQDFLDGPTGQDSGQKNAMTEEDFVPGFGGGIFGGGNQGSFNQGDSQNQNDSQGAGFGVADDDFGFKPEAKVLNHQNSFDNMGGFGGFGGNNGGDSFDCNQGGNDSGSFDKGGMNGFGGLRGDGGGQGLNSSFGDAQGQGMGGGDFFGSGNGNNVQNPNSSFGDMGPIDQPFGKQAMVAFGSQD
jgi:hypothetical protein